MKLYIRHIDTANMGLAGTALDNINALLQTRTVHSMNYMDGKLYVLYSDIVPDPVRQLTIYRVTTPDEETAISNFVNGKDIQSLLMLDNDIVIVLS